MGIAHEVLCKAEREVEFLLVIEHPVNNQTSDEDTVSFIVGNFRLTFAWQNGTGLSNPTVRAFII